jgi:hypothetical protein
MGCELRSCQLGVEHIHCVTQLISGWECGVHVTAPSAGPEAIRIAAAGCYSACGLFV